MSKLCLLTSLIFVLKTNTDFMIYNENLNSQDHNNVQPIKERQSYWTEATVQQQNTVTFM